VSGFEKSGTCEVTSHEPILVVDPLWEAIYGILWRPDPAPDGILEEAISAHINVLAHPRPAGGLTTNALVHFVGARTEEPLETLGRALATMRRQNTSLIVVLVMPVGTFRNRRDVVEETLGLRGARFRRSSLDSEVDEQRPDERSSMRLLITEDYGGGWTRTFDARTTPASYLMNAYGEFVWKQEERMDIEALAAALDEYCLPAPAPRTLPLRLTVQPGERALDAVFEEGHILALNRLRGQRVLLNFCQPWSAPCLHELAWLQRLHEEEGERAPVILVVDGGEERTVLAEVCRQHNFSFTLVHDAGSRIAQLYGVHCWPTTVSINPDGIVDRIQFGVAHMHLAEDSGKQAP
jgi:peroxiredoxin